MRKMFLQAYRVAIFIPMLRKYWLLQMTIASHFCNHCTYLQSLYRLLVKWFVPANPNSHARPLNGLKIYQQKRLLYGGFKAAMKYFQSLLSWQ